MKKHVIIAIATIIVVAVIVAIVSLCGSKLTNEEILNLKDSAKLDIIVNLEDYTSSNYDDSKLLDVAMQLANALGMVNTYSDDETYIEYVSREDLHALINEFTGLTVEAPIEIEDFYYLYDSENDYYYYRPSTPSYYSVSTINSVKENNGSYSISCTVTKTEDTELTAYAYKHDIKMYYTKSTCIYDEQAPHFRVWHIPC